MILIVQADIELKSSPILEVTHKGKASNHEEMCYLLDYIIMLIKCGHPCSTAYDTLCNIIYIAQEPLNHFKARDEEGRKVYALLVCYIW